MTPQQLKAMKMALEALKWCHGGEPCGTSEAITAIEESLAEHAMREVQRLGQEIEQGADSFCDSHCSWTDHHPDCKLAQPEQEPVIGTKTWFEDGKMVTQHLTAKDIYKEPEPVIDKSAATRIATSLGWEPKRKPLTDEEIDQITEQLDETTIGWSTHEFSRAIEAAHGIKENT